MTLQITHQQSHFTTQLNLLQSVDYYISHTLQILFNLFFTTKYIINYVLEIVVTPRQLKRIWRDICKQITTDHTTDFMQIGTHSDVTD